MPLPPGWRKKESKSRKGVFYYISPEGKTQWEKPTDSTKRSRDDAGDSSRDTKRSKSEEKVHVYHLLRKHKGSRRPSSWREEKISKTKEEALEEVKAYRETILGEIGGDESKLRDVFGKYASTESDCSSHKRNGDLGPFGRGEMQPEFEKASFALEVGKMSDVPVSTASGIHIIYRFA